MPLKTSSPVKKVMIESAHTPRNLWGLTLQLPPQDFLRLVPTVCFLWIFTYSSLGSHPTFTTVVTVDLNKIISFSETEENNSPSQTYIHEPPEDELDGSSNVKVLKSLNL